MMAKLNPRPVKRYRSAAYPTKTEVQADPGLLAEHIPQTWLSRHELAGTLGFFLAINAAGCNDWPSAVTRGGGSGDRKSGPAIVAPIFEHGEGRGSTGCVAVSPPTFLSEEEALQIIEEELKLNGLNISAREVELGTVRLPQRTHTIRRDWVSGRHDIALVDVPDTSVPLIVDLEDTQRHVVIEFISSADHDAAYASDGWFSSASSYDLRETARWMSDHVREQGRGVCFGAFYDPLTRASYRPVLQQDSQDREATWRQMKGRAEIESKRLLRLQVRDFVDWLKGQGVI